MHVTFSLRRNWRDMRSRVVTYLEVILLVTAIGTFCAVYKAHIDGVHGWLIGAVTVLSMFCASQFAVALVNRLAMMLAPPHRLPKMEFETGVPATCRTLVVVPTIISGTAVVDILVDALEVRFLANREDNIHFALLTDFSDADQETMPGDDEILQLADAGNPAPQREIRNERRVGFLSAASTAPVECARTRVDGRASASAASCAI